MKRTVVILIVISVLLVTVACGQSTPQGQPVNDGHRAAVAADNAMRLSIQNADQAEKIALLIDEVALLKEQNATKENERILYENSARDNQTVNAQVMWATFAWDIRFAVLVFVALVAAFGIAFVIVLKQALVTQKSQAKREMDAMRNELRNELHEAQRLVKLWRQAWAEAQGNVS